MTSHVLKNDGMGTSVPHGYRIIDRSKLPTTGGMDLHRVDVNDLARIGLERVCDPGQEGNLFGEVSE